MLSTPPSENQQRASQERRSFYTSYMTVYSMSGNLVSRGVRVLKKQGLFAFLKESTGFIYRNTFRQFIPKSGIYQTYNGVKVEEKRMGENLLNVLPDNPSYEGQFVEYIREYVEEGDSIVIIGGYYGVSTIAAATQSGNDGSVTTFEATPEGADRVRKTTQLNDVKQSVVVKATSVGPIYNEGVIESVTHEDAGCWNCVYERQHPARGDFYRLVLQCNGDRDARVVRAS